MFEMGMKISVEPLDEERSRVTCYMDIVGRTFASDVFSDEASICRYVAICMQDAIELDRRNRLAA
jgi:hypothetical protein